MNYTPPGQEPEHPRGEENDGGISDDDKTATAGVETVGSMTRNLSRDPIAATVRRKLPDGPRRLQRGGK